MGERIVMIHGILSGGWVWDSFKDYFESHGYQCLAPDLRHHDNRADLSSKSPLGTTSILDYVQDLEDMICRLDDKPILMGHSMGGLLAQILASRGLAKALVLIAPAAPRGVRAFTPSVLRGTWRNLAVPGFWHKPIVPRFAGVRYSMLHRLHPIQQKLVFAQMVPESGRAGFEMGFWQLDRNHATAVEFERVTCPILIIAGGQDRMTPPSLVRRIVSRYPTASFEEFPDHAHWIMDEPGWEDISEYCAIWLAKALAKLSGRPSNIPSEYPFGARLDRPIARIKARGVPPLTTEARVHRRKSIDLTVSASIPFSGNGQYYEIGHTLNISQGGVFMNTDLRLPPGTYVTIHLDYGGEGRPLWLQGQIKRLSAEGLAMQFSHVEAEKLESLVPE